MPKTTDLTDRRQLLAAAAATAVAAPETVRAATGPMITILGDSITAGYGLPSRDALPVQLQQALDELGAHVRIHAAGVSGDTTAGGLQRLDRAVPADTRLCVVALGGNDLLQFLPPATTRRNLDAIVSRLKGKGIPVLVAGIAAPPQLGAYAQAFNSVFPQVAHAHGCALYPDLLAGVMLDQALNQPDGVHPNARGVKVIAHRLAPVIKANLKV